MTQEQTDLVRRLREGFFADEQGFATDDACKAADMIEALAGGWRPIRDNPIPAWTRVIVAGVQPASSNVQAYWWTHEDNTDERGVPDERPDAVMWRPWPAPPEVSP